MKHIVMLIVSALGMCALHAEQEKPAATPPSSGLSRSRQIFDRSDEIMKGAFEDHIKDSEGKLKILDFRTRDLLPVRFLKLGLSGQARQYGSYPEISTNTLINLLERFYFSDIDTSEGRRRWHGTCFPYTYTNRNLRMCVEFYPDGFVYVYPDPPKKPRFADTNRVYRIQFNRAQNTSERLAVINDWAEEMTAEQLKAEMEEVKKRRSHAERLFDELDAPQKEYSARREFRLNKMLMPSARKEIEGHKSLDDARHLREGLDAMHEKLGVEPQYRRGAFRRKKLKGD